MPETRKRGRERQKERAATDVVMLRRKKRQEIEAAWKNRCLVWACAVARDYSNKHHPMETPGSK